jgi:hypothetical protein
MNTLVVLASLSHSASRKITEIGLLLGILGALAMAIGPFRGSRVGAFLLAAGLVLVLIAVHWGLNPYLLKG